MVGRSVRRVRPSILQEPAVLPDHLRISQPGLVLSLILLISLASFSMVPLAAQTSRASSSTIAGQVINGATGAPLARVLVQANTSLTFTDHEGRFSFSDGGPVGSLQLTKPGFSSSPEHLDAPSFVCPAAAAQAQACEFFLWPDAVLTGTVRNSEGDPLPRIPVDATRTLFENGVRRREVAGSALSDSHGSFRIPVPAGDYALGSRYTPPGVSSAYAVLPATVPAHSNDAGGTLIHLNSGQELHFDWRPVTAPAYRYTVQFEPLPDWQVPRISLETGDGAIYQPAGLSFSSAGLTMEVPSGTYRLSARIRGPEGLRTGEATIEVPAGNANGPTIHLETTTRVPVLVSQDPNDPSSGDGAVRLPSATALNLQLNRVDGLSMTDEATFRIASYYGGLASFSVPPGTYSLSGGEGSGWLIKSASFAGADLLRTNLLVNPNGGAEPIQVVVSHRTGTISGITRVRGIPTQCWVVLVSAEAVLPRIFQRRSDVQGQLTITGLGLGTYHALAMPFLHSANFADPAVLDAYKTYVTSISVGASSGSSITLDAKPAEDLF